MMRCVRSLFVSLFICLPIHIYAFERDDMHARTLRILQLSHNQGDYSSYSKMMELYQDMRDKIKSDLELGNNKAAVDYELLLEGLVLENYSALQSVLGFNNYNDTTKEFSDEINRSYSQKLAYALKQNKIVFQTRFDVKKSYEQNDCEVVLNGKEIKQLSFSGPAGVPFYIGIYCPEKRFEVKKIQAAESQKFYTISFNNLKPIVYRDDPADMDVPNANTSIKSNAKNVKSRLSLFGSNDMQVSLGVGIDWYVSYNPRSYYHYPSTGAYLLFYSSNQFVYKNFEFVLDLGPVVKSTKSNTAAIEKERTLFVRPVFLYKDKIYKYKDIFLVDANLGVSIFFVGTENFIKPVSYGFKAGLEPKVYLAKPFFVGGDLGITYYFAGSIENSMLMGTALRVGVDF